MDHQDKKIDFADAILTAIDWIKKHREVVISVSAVVIIATALTVYIFSKQKSIKETSWDKLSMAQGYIQNNLINQGLDLLNQIIQQAGNSTSAQYARLSKADILYKNRDYKQAIDIYKEIIKIGKPGDIMPSAYLGMGNSLESLDNYQEAINTYKELIDKFPDHYVTGRTYESLARVYEFTGALNDAMQTYEKLVTLYPGETWSQKAQIRMAAISGKPLPGTAKEPEGEVPAENPSGTP